MASAEQLYDAVISGTAKGLQDSLPVLVSAGTVRVADLITDQQATATLASAADTAKLALIVVGIIAIVWMVRK